MCGRYASFRDTQDLVDEFAIATVADDVRLLPASWNLAPTDRVRMVVERPDRSTGQVTRQLRAARWGLVPPWASDPAIGTRMINARVETVRTARSYARAFRSRRALLPADGYYEWQRPSPGSPTRHKQPFYIHATDGSALALAGLYEFWRDPTRADDDPARWLVTTTVLTRPATPQLAHVHERQPLVLPPAQWATWLAPDTDPAEAALVLAADPPSLTARPVPTRVNRVGTDGPELLDELTAGQAPPQV